MKRALWMVGVLVALVVAIPVVVGSALSGNRSIEDGKVLPAGAKVIQDGHTSVAIIPIAERGVALVDAGADPKGTAILAELSRRGLGPNDVRTILLTHGHSDHTGACRAFPRAEVLALESEVGLIEGKVGNRGPVTRFLGVHPTGIVVSRPLKDGESVTLGSTIAQVFAVPGHTRGSAAYLINGVLYLGDSAQVSKAGDLRPAVWAFSDDAAQNRASLVDLARRLKPKPDRVKVLMTAHSGTLEGYAPLEVLASSL